MAPVTRWCENPFSHPAPRATRWCENPFSHPDARGNPFPRAAALLLLLVAGCQRSTPTNAASATSQPGDATPTRIISAAPNVTEILCALGLRDRLVGRTRYCTYPPEVQSVPNLGTLTDLNIEAVAALRPDLILIAGHSAQIADRFTRAGLRFESVPDDSLADLFTSIRRIGTLTGRSADAERLCKQTETEFDDVTRRYAAGPRARVLLLTAVLSEPPTGPFVAGPGSFYDELLRRAGHTNVVSDRAFGPMSLELIAAANPDVIIELDPDGTARPHGDADALRVWQAVGPLRAVRQHRVHVLVGPQHYVLGPRLPQTYAALCAAIAEPGHD